MKDQKGDDFITRLIDEHNAQEAELDKEFGAKTAEELAQHTKNYPTDQGGWTRNPYLD